MSGEQMTALEQRVKPATAANKYQPYRKGMSYRDGDAVYYAGAGVRNFTERNGGKGIWRPLFSPWPPVQTEVSV